MNAGSYSTMPTLFTTKAACTFMKYLPYIITSIVALVLDQISKYAILARFEFAERLNIIPNLFDLTLVYNPGAAFSFLANANGWQKYLFMLLAFVISAFLAHEIRKGKMSRWGNFAAAMIIGGAFGNVIDRFVHGKVVDFLLFYWQNWSYPVFNIADCFVCVGAALLVWDNWRQGKRKVQAA